MNHVNQRSRKQAVFCQRHQSHRVRMVVLEITLCYDQRLFCPCSNSTKTEASGCGI